MNDSNENRYAMFARSTNLDAIRSYQDAVSQEYTERQRLVALDYDTFGVWHCE